MCVKLIFTNVSTCSVHRSLRSEKVDLRDQKEHRLAEREKSALHGKKSRKERKMLKESIVAAKRHSPRRCVCERVCDCASLSEEIYSAESS